MQIPSYQISNVIKVYSKQLSQSRMINRQDNSFQKRPLDTIKISAEGKRQTLINKVSDEVFSRITQYDRLDSNEQDVVNKLNSKIKKNQRENEEKESEFVFNFLGDDNEKVTNTISIEGSNVISKRLDTLDKDSNENDTES